MVFEEILIPDASQCDMKEGTPTFEVDILGLLVTTLFSSHMTLSNNLFVDAGSLSV